MARINLLPWRQAERERKNREFMTIVAGVLLLSLLAAFGAWYYFDNILNSQKQANDNIKAENAKLDIALTKIDTLEKQRNDMLAQMKVIQDLQGRRPIPVRVWDDIARVIPPQLYLISMNRTGDVISFTGKADNPNVVSDFIRNLDASQWLEGSEVKSITQPNTVAYTQTAPPATPTTPANAPVVHPEDNYVTFVVTTKIAKALTADSTTAGTAMSATSATAITTATSVPTATAISAPAKTVQPMPNVSASSNVGVTSGGSTSISSVHTTPPVATSTTSAPTPPHDALKPVTNTATSTVTSPPPPTANKENK